LEAGVRFAISSHRSVNCRGASAKRPAGNRRGGRGAGSQPDASQKRLYNVIPHSQVVRGNSLVPKLHLGMQLSWQLHCPGHRRLRLRGEFLEAQLRRQARSQVQLGNEGAQVRSQVQLGNEESRSCVWAAIKRSARRARVENNDHLTMNERSFISADSCLPVL
jgi:hypothetical protein